MNEILYSQSGNDSLPINTQIANAVRWFAESYWPRERLVYELQTVDDNPFVWSFHCGGNATYIATYTIGNIPLHGARIEITRHHQSREEQSQ